MNPQDALNVLINLMEPARQMKVKTTMSRSSFSGQAVSR